MQKNLGAKWILILGGFGFLSGFIGPMIFAPDANQGPLLGILITGPLGVMAGVFLWLLSRLLNWSIDLQFKIAGIGCLLFIVALGVIASAPKPEWPGRIYQIEVATCTSAGNDEVTLATTILEEKLIKVEKPLFGDSFMRVIKITTQTPQHLSFYIKGSCAEFPTGFKGFYYVENHPKVARDKAVLLPVPEEYLRTREF